MVLKGNTDHISVREVYHIYTKNFYAIEIFCLKVRKMKTKDSFTPWVCLDEYRGTYFNGEWPTLPEMFEINAKRYSKEKCFECFDPKHISFTYGEALDIVKKIASKLKKNGVKDGDKVAVIGKNSPEWALAYLGVLFADAVVVPLDNSLPFKDVNHLASFAGVEFIFADKDKYEGLETEGSVKYAHKVCLEDIGDDYILNWCSNESVSNEKEPTKFNRNENDIAAILFTSGTTGFPKGVTLTHKNFVSDCYLAQANMNIYHTDTFYAILPIHHAYTMLAVFIEAISVGAAIVFGKRLAVQSLLSDLKRGNVTMFLAVPMLFNKFIAGVRKNIDAKGKVVQTIMYSLINLSSRIKKRTGKNIGRVLFKSILKKLSMDKIRICISGGGPLPESTFHDFNALGIDFVQGYGMTETSPILTLNPTYDYVESSVGKVIAGTELKIVDPDSDGNGVIYAKGPMVMSGYYNNPDATKEVLTPDGWICTGDVGHLDERNYLYLTGRAKNIIVTEGGKNVFPEEIEDAFQLCTDIEQILVTGYSANKERKVEGIRAIIKPTKECEEREGSIVKIKAKLESIVEEVNKRLPSYKRITKVDVTDEKMPTSSTMKIKRFEVAKKIDDKNEQ